LFTHALDDILGDAPVDLGFLHAGANHLGHGAGARKQVQRDHPIQGLIKGCRRSVMPMFVAGIHVFLCSK
jgi:hypothetical protein